MLLFFAGALFLKDALLVGACWGGEAGAARPDLVAVQPEGQCDGPRALCAPSAAEQHQGGGRGDGWSKQYIILIIIIIHLTRIDKCELINK